MHGDSLTTSRRMVGPVFVALFAISIAYHAWWIMQPRERLAGAVAWEDAFYYFQTARNVARGEGSVSSGGIEHNGYHPLWMFLCAGVYRVAGEEGLLAIRIILAIGAALGMLSVVLLYRLLRLLGVAPPAALIAVACYWLNPWMLALAICGLEAPLQAVLLIATISWTLRPGGRRPRWLFYGVLGVLFALVFLVRTDNVFFLAATALWIVWRVRRDRRQWVWLAGSVVFSILLASPWLLWNLAKFGSIVQGSAGALPTVREIAWFGTHPGATRVDFLRHRLILTLEYFPAVLWYTGLGSLWYVLFAAVAGALAVRRGRREGVRLGLALLECAPLALAVVGLGFAHKFVRLATREWYYVPSDILMALVLGIALSYLLRLAYSPRLRTILVVLLAALPLVWLGRKNVQQWRERSAPGHDYAFDIVRAFDGLSLVPPDEPVGCTDSGIVGYYCTHPVINLDGVVNPLAARAIREGRLADYVAGTGIRFLTVTPRMYNEQVWGRGFVRRVTPFPLMTAQGYRFVRPESGESAVPEQRP